MQKSSIFTLLILLGLPGMALAQEKFGFEIGGYAARANWQGRSVQVGPPQASPPINLGFNYDDKNAYGVRFNLLSQGHWGGELAYSYQKNTVRLTRQPLIPVALDGGVHHFFYNMVFYPMHYSATRLMPFATAGVGVAGYHLSDEARGRAADPRVYGLGKLESIDKRFAFNYGVGVKVGLIISGLGIRADLRHIFSDVPSYGLPKESSNRNQMVLPFQGKLQTYEGSAGIYFHFLK
jgi:hypothetical protein